MAETRLAVDIGGTFTDLALEHATKEEVQPLLAMAEWERENRNPTRAEALLRQAAQNHPKHAQDDRYDDGPTDNPEPVRGTVIPRQPALKAEVK